jgi:hypothetical protein
MYPSLLSSAPKLNADKIGSLNELPVKNTFIHVNDAEDDGGAVAPRKTCPGSVGSKTFQDPTPIANAAYSGLQTEVNRRKKTVSFDAGEDSPASTSSNPTYSWARTKDSFDTIDDVRDDQGHLTSGERSVEKKEFVFAVPNWSANQSGLRTELPEKHTFVHFDVVDEDGGPMVPTKSCPASMESKRSQAAEPISAAIYNDLRTELQKKKAVSFEDGEDSPASISPNPSFTWTRTMDGFDTIDDLQDGEGRYTPGETFLRSVQSKEFALAAPSWNVLRTDLPEKNTFAHFDNDKGAKFPTKAIPGSVESNEFAVSRNPQEAAHLGGECQPCAYFALRADGCRLGDLC